jgi:hypothetical protein
MMGARVGVDGISVAVSVGTIVGDGCGVSDGTGVGVEVSGARAVSVALTWAATSCGSASAELVCSIGAAQAARVKIVRTKTIVIEAILFIEILLHVQNTEIGGILSYIYKKQQTTSLLLANNKELIMLPTHR